MVINTVGHLAEAAWHHPDITASYAWVEVRLMNHAAKGITDKDFDLAKKIEDVVHWQPGKEGGALEGTPAEDMRFAYIKYDKPKKCRPRATPVRAIIRALARQWHLFNGAAPWRRAGL